MHVWQKECPHDIVVSGAESSLQMGHSSKFSGSGCREISRLSRSSVRVGSVVSVEAPVEGVEPLVVFRACWKSPGPCSLSNETRLEYDSRSENGWCSLGVRSLSGMLWVSGTGDVDATGGHVPAIPRKGFPMCGSLWLRGAVEGEGDLLFSLAGSSGRNGILVRSTWTAAARRAVLLMRSIVGFAFKAGVCWRSDISLGFCEVVVVVAVAVVLWLWL